MLVPALSGCVTHGKIVEVDIEMFRDAITGYVESPPLRMARQSP